MEAIFILYVKNQETSCNLYKKILHQEPCLHVPGMTEFLINEKTKIGLMPETGIAKILSNKTKHPEIGNGIPRAEIYLLVSNLEDYYNRALELGLAEISGIEKRSWGDYACYFSDPDGHIIVFAKKEK